jgi:hypothetical protein
LKIAQNTLLYNVVCAEVGSCEFDGQYGVLTSSIDGCCLGIATSTKLCCRGCGVPWLGHDSCSILSMTRAEHQFPTVKHVNLFCDNAFYHRERQTTKSVRISYHYQHYFTNRRFHHYQIIGLRTLFLHLVLEALLYPSACSSVCT